MKGFVNQNLNERQQHPGVNAPISRFYKSGDVLEVTGAALGDVYDDDDLWYTLDNGAFVWNGAVDIEPVCSTDNIHDKEQFIISYRKVMDNGRPDMVTQDPADELYFTPVILPAKETSIRFNHLIAENFANGLIASIDKLNDRSRNHVFLYIHGYQPFSSLKLDLFSGFVNNYMNHPKNKIAKVLFMVWPAQGLSRKRADDRAMEAGRNFTRNHLFDTFEHVADKLREKNIFLNLVVHSFGHQLLNGMLEHFDCQALNGQPIFKNVFLMASDVTHLALNQTLNGTGFDLPNFFGRTDSFKYDYSKLKCLSENVQVFYDEFDYLLYASTKKFVGGHRIARQNSESDRLRLTANYRNLGNYGVTALKDPFQAHPGFQVRSVQTLVDPTHLINLCDFPWRTYDADSMFRRHIEQASLRGDYEGFGLLDIIFNKRRLENYHKYVFTCKPVVDEVQSMLT